MSDIEQVDTRHAEAKVLAFTRIWRGGLEWSITIREGVTDQQIEQILVRMDTVANYTSTRQAMGGQETPENDGSSHSASYSPDAQPVAARMPRSSLLTSGSDTVNRIEIAGSIERPLVKMWSTNTALQYPVHSVPADQVQRHLEVAYGPMSENALGQLYQCGRSINVNWNITWVVSPKNIKWKDVTGITRLEQS